MTHSEAIDALAAALANAQGQMEGALKASANPFFKSKYADLKSVWEACRAPLAANALSVVQTARCEHPSKEVNELKQIMDKSGLPPSVIVTTFLMHNSGQWIRDELTMWPKDNSPQGIGSCISYARRYALAAMVGVYQADDDAENAEGRKHVEDATTPHDTDELQAQLHDVVAAIKAGDAPLARRRWDELNALGTVGSIWRALNTKQKKALRDMLQTTVATTSATSSEQVQQVQEQSDDTAE